MKPLEQKKRQKILFGILMVVAVVTVFVWYTNYQKKPTSEESVSRESSLGVSVTEERLKEMQLDLSVLNNNLFKSLKSHGTLPIIVGETGRENPFEPY